MWSLSFFCAIVAIFFSGNFSLAGEQNASRMIESLSKKSPLHQDRQWLKLLHHEPGFWGFRESQIDGPSFFIHPKGKTNPDLELLATVAEFMRDSERIGAAESELYQCRFPARFLWITRKIMEAKLEVLIHPVPCPKFANFKGALTGESVSLVFSSFYLNSPSSAFGHTFLRINKPADKQGQRYELLDYGVNYAANMDTDNAIVYAIRGLFGMFRGTFTTLPYYYKVREYAHAESRDLWDYEIPMTPLTMEMFIAHVWEMGPIDIDYWYLTENCSYHMLTILEAADPNYDFQSDLKKYVIPSDTVQLVWKQNLSHRYHYRPSIRSQLLSRGKSLSEQELELVIEMAQNLKKASALDSLEMDRKVAVLDTVLDFMDFQYAIEVQKPDTKESQFKNEILLLRSGVPAKSPTLNVEEPALLRPHEAHSSRRLDFQYGSGGEYLFGYKFALHDHLDPIRGYPEYAKINFWDMRFSYLQKTENLDLRDWSFFEIVSISPLSWYQRRPSWRVKLGVEQMRNENEDRQRWFHLSPGVGYTMGFNQDQFLGYLGLRAVAGARDRGEGRTLFGIGPNLILRYRLDEFKILYAEHWRRLDLQMEKRIYQETWVGGQWSWNRTMAVRAGFVDHGFDRQLEMGLLWYQ